MPEWVNLPCVDWPILHIEEVRQNTCFYDKYLQLLFNSRKDIQILLKSFQFAIPKCVLVLRGGEKTYALTLQKAKKLLSGMFSFFNKSYLHQFQNVKAHRLYIR